MLILFLASVISYTMLSEFLEVTPQEKGVVHFETGYGLNTVHLKEKVRPLSELAFNNIVRQAYDYSCGSAALTTLLDFYLGRNFQERQVMEGLLQFGDAEKIAERRGFSLLDMKKLVTALGHPSGGFKAEAEDLLTLDHPAIAPIEYAGFKHFVVIRGVRAGHVYIADPSKGNISFTMARFLEVWDRNVLFIVFPNGHKPVGGLELRDEDLRVIDERTFTQLTYRDFRDVFPVDHMTEPFDFSNGLARAKNNAYWDEGADAESQFDDVLLTNGDTGFDKTKANTVSSDSVVRKHIRFKRK